MREQGQRICIDLEEQPVTVRVAQGVSGVGAQWHSRLVGRQSRPPGGRGGEGGWGGSTDDGTQLDMLPQA